MLPSIEYFDDDQNLVNVLEFESEVKKKKKRNVEFECIVNT
jgi:hypothetical protein